MSDLIALAPCVPCRSERVAVTFRTPVSDVGDWSWSLLFEYRTDIGWVGYDSASGNFSEDVASHTFIVPNARVIRITLTTSDGSSSYEMDTCGRANPPYPAWGPKLVAEEPCPPVGTTPTISPTPRSLIKAGVLVIDYVWSSQLSANIGTEIFGKVIDDSSDTGPYITVKRFASKETIRVDMASALSDYIWATNTAIILESSWNQSTDQQLTITAYYLGKQQTIIVSPQWSLSGEAFPVGALIVFDTGDFILQI